LGGATGTSPRFQQGSGWHRFDSKVATTRRVVALKNGLNGSKLAAFALYTEHSHTTVPKLSIFNADHIVWLHKKLTRLDKIRAFGFPMGLRRVPFLRTRVRRSRNSTGPLWASQGPTVKPSEKSLTHRLLPPPVAPLLLTITLFPVLPAVALLMTDRHVTREDQIGIQLVH